MLDVCLLGTAGTMPVFGRWFSACLVRHGGRLILIDCGEGTQMTARQLGWGFKAIEAILITHVHADHLAGLPGMLLSIANSDRTEPLFIFGPPGITPVVQGLRAVAPYLPYEVACVELDGMDTPLWDGLQLGALAVRHTVPCLAWRLDVPRSRPFLPDRAERLGVPRHRWHELQRGRAVELPDRLVRPDEVQGEQRRGIRFAFITDTLPMPALGEFVSGADLLICEGMYAGTDDTPPPEERKHLTFAEAAAIARNGGVRELWLTHFSPALSHPEEGLATATAIFPNTSLGFARRTTTLRFPDEEENQGPSP